jgi:branched-chain amino acid transport system substrate-binding protein
MKKISALIVAVLLVGSFGFTPVYSADKISFGFSVPLTGLFGKAGKVVLDSYKLWAKKMNSEGGILIGGKRYPVALVYYDDKSNPGLSARFFEKLITDDKVDLLLGGYGSSLVFAASAVSEKYKYPMICGAASSNKLFKRGFEYYFSTLGKATEEVRGCVEMLKVLKKKPKTVAIIGSDILFTSLACEGFKTYSEKAGFKIVYFELFPVRLKDYNAMLFKVKKTNPDVLLVGSHIRVAIKTIRAMKAANFSPKAVAFSYGPTLPDFVKSVGKDGEFVFAASEWTSNLPYKGVVFGSAADFNKAYFKEYKRFPDYVAAAASAAAVTQQIALQKLGLQPPYNEAKRVALMKELHMIDAKTFYGEVRFGKEGANVAHLPVAVQIQNGKVVNVYPKKVRQAAPKYPMPTWKKR